MADGRVRIGIIGSQFEADVLAAAVAMGCHGEVVAVASPTAGHAAALARRYGIATATQDYRELLADPDIELLALAVPNHLHCAITLEAAAAGKHVMVEKPMALTLDECDRMIAACRAAGVHLFYGEELFFTPKYAKAKEMADQGAFGSVFLVKQSEMHFGPTPTGSGMSSVPVVARSWIWGAMAWRSATGFSAGQGRWRLRRIWGRRCTGPAHAETITRSRSSSSRADWWAISRTARHAEGAWTTASRSTARMGTHPAIC